MKALCVAFALVGFVLFAPGCIDDKCKNPQRISEGGQERNAIKCNAIVVCSYGGRTSREPLDKMVDPVIQDTYTESENKKQCLDRVKQKLWDQYSKQHCEFDASPAVICLDGQGAPDGSGPDVGSPTGGTLVTVGVGGGDYYLQSEGEGGAGGFGSEGEGGAGGFGSESEDEQEEPE
jgi:hypothetical protein